jgi:hypothetical protein
MRIDKLCMFFMLIFTILLSSCGTLMPDMSRMQDQARLMQQLASSPDLPTWQNNRESVVQSLGDRVIDQPFDRVFNSIVTALGSLELSVQNMERASMYIVATGIPIPTGEKMELQEKELIEYCRFYGYDPRIVEIKKGDYMNPAIGRVMTNSMPTLTFSLVKQKENQTKVKIRASNIYYPPTLEEVYKVVWLEIDKQIFLDKSLD